MSEIESITRCPTCASEVLVEGKEGSTQFYVPKPKNPTEKYWYSEAGRRDQIIGHLVMEKQDLIKERDSARDKALQDAIGKARSWYDFYKRMHEKAQADPKDQEKDGLYRMFAAEDIIRDLLALQELA